MITMQLCINGDRDETYTVELPAVPRVGENLIYSRNVWHKRTLVWTVAKVLYVPAQDKRNMSITLVLADGMAIMNDDDDD